MAENPAIEERYRKYLDKLKDQGENVTTRTKAFFKDLFYIHERRENAGIELPPEILEGRRANDMLHRIERHLINLEDRTEDIQSSVGSFWSGIGQMLADRKAKKKTK